MVVGAVRAGVAVLALLAPPAAGHTAAVAGPARQPAPPDEPLSLLVATEGRPSTEAAYPFVVGEGASISGKLRFLSQEYPTYYGSEYNDLFSVALATPQGAVVLATGNLNNSTWGEGSQGYGGTAQTLSFDEDLHRFAGQTVELQIHVANVADTLYDSAVAVFDLRIDDQPACGDDRLAERHGVPDGGGKRDRLDGFDPRFDGLDGARLRSLVETVAAEAGVSPGLLAVSALAQEPAPAEWLSPKAVPTGQSGVEDWERRSGQIRKAVPGAPRIPTSGGSFANGRDALRAMAWSLRYAEVRMGAEAGAAYTGLPSAERFTLQLLAFDEDVPDAVAALEDDSGGVLVTDGAVGADDPHRTATVRAAQAVHLANAVFGEGASCA
jgi:hypothetical protein